jgi:hypothetical protein
MKNEILEEIWETRKEIEKDHGGDLLKVFKSMNQRTSVSKRRAYHGSLRRKSPPRITPADKDKKPSSPPFAIRRSFYQRPANNAN